MFANSYNYNNNNNINDNKNNRRGRVLIQMKIDFEKLRIESMKCGIVNIDENRCKIVCYDDTRHCVIIDTKKATFVKYSDISNSEKYTKYRNGYLYVENRLDKYENLQKKYDSDNDDKCYMDESSDIRREAILELYDSMIWLGNGKQLFESLFN